MEWIDIDDISKVNVVEDFYNLLKVLNDPDINEFQYAIADGSLPCENPYNIFSIQFAGMIDSYCLRRTDS